MSVRRGAHVCDDPHGPGEPGCPNPVIGWAPGVGDFCAAHRPARQGHLAAGVPAPPPQLPDPDDEHDF